MTDALAAWLAVREQLDLSAACTPPLRTGPGPDGVAVHLATVVEQRDPARAARRAMRWRRRPSSGWSHCCSAEPRPRLLEATERAEEVVHN